MDFKLTSQYKPTGDQPEAIRQLVEGVNNQDLFQTLLGLRALANIYTSVGESFKYPPNNYRDQ